jgi:hypothetical protein
LWLCGAGGLALAGLAAHTAPRPAFEPAAPIAASAPDNAPATLALSPLLMAQLDRDQALLHPEFISASQLPAFVGPPIPNRVSNVFRSLPGRIGPLGPITGPVSAALPDGLVLGPQWERKPLPNVFGPPAPNRAATAALPPRSDLSSELPDPRTIALSRLAHPDLEVRKSDASRSVAVSAENPLNLHLVLGGKRDPRVGEAVTAHVTANAECYAALILVDAAGKASTLFKTPAPTRSFSILVKAGPSAGSEYLLAVASVHPLSGSDITAALNGGSAFPAVAAAVEGSVQPAVAWGAAVAQAATLAGAPQHPHHFETATAVAGVAVRPSLLASRPGGASHLEAGNHPSDHPAPKPAPHAEGGDTSVVPSVPTPAAPENKPAGNEASPPKSDAQPESILPQTGTSATSGLAATASPAAALTTRAKTAVAQAPAATAAAHARKRKRRVHRR